MRRAILIFMIIDVLLLISFVVFSGSITDNSSYESTDFKTSILDDTIFYPNDNYVYENEQLITDQEENLELIAREFSSGDYDVSNPYIVVNPYLYNALTALVMFTSDEQYTDYTYRVVGKTANADFEYSSKISEDEQIVVPIMGLYANFENTVNLSLTTQSGRVKTITLKITTDEVFDKSSNATISDAERSEFGMEEAVTNNVEGYSNPISVDTIIHDQDRISPYLENGFILTETYDMYDTNGDLRSNTDIIYGNDSLKLDDGTFYTMRGDMIFRETLLGEILETYYVPQTTNYQVVLHHDLVLSDDGKYLYVLAGFSPDTVNIHNEDLNIDTPTISIETFVLEYSTKEQGLPLNYWDFQKFFNYGHPVNQVKTNATDTVHFNSIDYFEERDLIVTSSKNQSAIVGYSVGEDNAAFIIQDPSLVNEKNKSLNLEPVGDNMVYPSGQHSVFLMYTNKYNSAGDTIYLSLFNNNNCKTIDEQIVVSDSGDTCQFNQYSEMMIYKIDLVKRTVELVEEIRPDEDRYSKIRSSVFTNHEGIYEINYSDVQMVDDQGKLYDAPLSDLYITDTSGEVIMSVRYEGLGNIYRSRLITQDEIYAGLDAFKFNLDQ